MLEAAFVMPVLVPLLFGFMEFSWYFHKQQLVESGVRDAARYLARAAPDNGTSPCTLTTPVDFKARAQNIAVTGVATGGTPRVPGWTAADVLINCDWTFDNSASPPPYQGAATIYRITASTSFADPQLGFFGMLKLPVPNLRASHTERSIGRG